MRVTSICIFLLSHLLLGTFSYGAETGLTSGLSVKNLELLSEAVQKIQETALSHPKSENSITGEMLDAFLRWSDPYADYLTSKEFAAYLESADADYFGVQMELVSQENRILLYPFAGGVAERSGIQAGDELIAINGKPVYGKSIYLAGIEIRGAGGEVVQLILRSGKEISRTVTIRREATTYSAISSSDIGKTRYIRISRFTPEVPDKVLLLLQSLPNEIQFLVFDLRKNHGGSLRSARKCADYLQPAATTLFYVKKRSGIETVKAKVPMISDRRLIIIQDETTASAAEVFIASLTHNGRAHAVGKTSYGKGLAQRFVELSDGSALLLTYAELLIAGQKSYHSRGLIPRKNLPETLMQADFTKGQALEKLLSFIGVSDQPPMEEL